MQNDDTKSFDLLTNPTPEQLASPKLIHEGEEFSIKGQVYVITRVRNTYITAKPKAWVEAETENAGKRLVDHLTHSDDDGKSGGEDDE